jgi:uncharacterized membrane protein YcaP (DUF421 family)
MWLFDNTLLSIVLRTAIIYIVVLVGIRLSGKREIGQMTPFDLVLLLLIANAVQNAMTGPDTSITGGVVAAATLLLINTIVSRIVRRNKKLRTWVEGTPTILVRHGNVVPENLVKERIPIEELRQAFREHGVAALEDVALAVLEVDGTISVLTKEELPPTPRPHHRIKLLSRKN